MKEERIRKLIEEIYTNVVEVESKAVKKMGEKFSGYDDADLAVASTALANLESARASLEESLPLSFCLRHD